MRELAVQSSTDTNVDILDRESMDNEFKQLGEWTIKLDTPLTDGKSIEIGGVTIGAY